MIRNFALIGHGSSGKTSLAEAILYKVGVTSRLGSIEKGNTVLDFDPEEIKRKYSINLSVASFEWEGVKFNLVDTPGYLDFLSEVYCGLRAVDSAVLVVGADTGAEVGTEKTWEIAEKYNLPVIIVISKISVGNPENVLEQLRDIFGASVSPVERIENGKIVKLWETKDESFIESVVELSEELMDKYFESGEVSDEELKNALKEGIKKREFFPVLFVDSIELKGIDELLSFMKEYGVEPTETYKNGDKPRVFVFKTLSDPHVGDLNYVRVFSGEIKSGLLLYNVDTSTEEKIGQISKIIGKERKEVDKLSFGDIGALVKLKTTKTGHTLVSKEDNFKFPPLELPEPLVSIAIVPKTREDEEKVSDALNKIKGEQPVIKAKYDPELKQTLLWGLGELQLDVVISKLKERFKVEVNTERPRIPYRETIRKQSQGMGKYVKQSGGRGQYGICYIRIEPLPRGKGYEFVNAIFGGAIPSQYIPAVETGIKKAMQSGVPVLSSNTSSLPEVVGKGGIMHHPQDYKSFAKDIKRLYEDEKFYQEMQKKAIIQAKNFSWEKSAKELLLVFEKIFL